MKPQIKLEGDRLEITFSDVQDKDRGRLCNVELALLRAYQGHHAYPWEWKDSKAVVQWVRSRSAEYEYNKAREVLKGFMFEV